VRFQRTGERAAEAALEPIEQPGNAEREDEAEMPAVPGQRIQALWNCQAIENCGLRRE
jgi:hypothetical protein